ncbi:hypothetical protein [Oceaniglobus roseus]|uniref:hypothetical protein n=1 Tax=Oceaniglobus roseus TaxID=1737570 RepID=UPI001FE6DFB0|nr:hypothetical protein [Kandeliimicrobium roseum]
MTRTTGLGALLLLTVIGVAGCEPVVPDSGQGVGFQDYEAYERQRAARETALRSGGYDAQQPSTATNPAPVDGGISTSRVISDEDLRAAGLPVGDGTSSLAVGPGTTELPPATLPPAEPVSGAPLSATQPVGNNPGISDEQDFSAVSSRESIESDRARIENNRENYRVVQPTALPSRPAESDPNIVAYALSTTNRVGQPVYSRSSRNADSKFQRACAGYGSSDRAQEDFLKNGGPQKDNLGVDPDGDGFACYWDPSPFRSVANN